MDQAEQLRIIKANKQIRPTARVITVTSGKGGVGKSNMSINLAIQFRKMGKRVDYSGCRFRAGEHRDHVRSSAEAQPV